MFYSYSTIFFAFTDSLFTHPRKSKKKSKKKFKSQKNSLLLYILVILSLPFGLCQLMEKLTGLVPRTTDSQTTLFYQVFISPLLWYLVRKLSLCTYLHLLLLLHIFIHDKTFKIITPVSRYINHLSMRARLWQITEAYLAINFFVSTVMYPLLVLPLFSTQGCSR